MDKVYLFRATFNKDSLKAIEFEASSFRDAISSVSLILSEYAVDNCLKSLIKLN